MSNPTSAPGPAGAQTNDPYQQPGRGASGPDPDEPNPFGPDAPNVREDDPPGGQVVPEAPPPQPPATPLDYGDFAPDET
jgi:hypothetical protein